MILYPFYGFTKYIHADIKLLSCRIITFFKLLCSVTRIMKYVDCYSTQTKP